MKIFAPNYYKKFSCIADKCKHSCCIGWEIDIDTETYEQYKNINTEFGKKLFDNIVLNDDYACFKLTDNERCPFLNKNNLCEIILNLGENALCQICSDHPRFRNYYGDRVEMGLGLCCEEAAKIVVNEAQPFKLVEIDCNDEESIIFEDELEFSKLRNEIFDIIENSSSFKLIVEKLFEKFNVNLPQKTFYEWIDIYLNLEQLDNNWSALLKSAKMYDDIQFTLTCLNENAIKNLFTYFIYRHLGEAIYDGYFKGRLLFAVLSCYMIITLNNVNHNIEEIARMYSSEIEYSDENLNKLIEILQKETP